MKKIEGIILILLLFTFSPLYLQAQEPLITKLVRSQRSIVSIKAVKTEKFSK